MGLDAALNFPGWQTKSLSPVKKILRTAPADLLAIWTHNDTAATLVDSSPAARNATLFGSYVQQQRGMGDGGHSIKYTGGGANTYGAIGGVFNGAAGTIDAVVQLPLAMWTDGTTRYLFDFWGATGGNIVRGYRPTGNNLLNFEYRAGSVVKSISYNVPRADQFRVTITWDAAVDEFKLFIDGVQFGATQTGLGVWAGALSSTETCIGARNTAGADPFTGGWIQNAAVWSIALTPVQISNMTSFTPRWGNNLLYISATGDDGNSGLDVDHPVATWTKIEELFDTSNDYGTVLVVPGTYTQTFQIVTENAIVIGTGAVIDGQDTRAYCVDVRVPGVSLTGFETTQATAANIYIYNVSHCNVVGGAAHDSVIGIRFLGGSYHLASGVETYANTGRGIYVDASTYWRVEYQKGHTDGYSFECETNSNNGVASNCWWYSNTTHGGILKTSQDCEFLRCVAFSNGGAGFYFKAGEDCKITNCVSYANATGALLTQNDAALPGSTGAILKNNIFSGNTTGVSVDTNSETGFTSDHNDYYNNTGLGSWGGAAKADLAAWQAATGGDANSLEVDPDFVSVVYGGFVPQAAAVLTGANDGGPMGYTG